jgi:hypothetical protein
MKKLAEKYETLWFILGLIPLAAFVYLFGEIIGAESSTIVSIQIPCLVLQLFGVFMSILSTTSSR